MYVFICACAEQQPDNDVVQMEQNTHDPDFKKTWRELNWEDVKYTKKMSKRGGLYSSVHIPGQ